MKKSVYLLSIILVASILSGCIISKSPNANNVTVAPGAATTFSVIILPPGGTYTWTLDNALLSNATSSYQYTPTGGIHTLAVIATHIFGTDTQTWHITCPEASAPIGSTGGTVAVTETNSPLYGAQADIPAGALSTTVTLTISQATAPAGLPGQPAGPFVDFGPKGTQFSSPVELSLPYADADNDGIVDGTGISEDLVNAYYYNETTSAWEDVPVIGRDKALNLVRIQVTHLSEYITGVTGFVTWQRLWGGAGDEGLYDVKTTQDGCYVSVGNHFTNSTYDCNVIKFDSRGQIIWEQIYDITGLVNVATSVQPTSDGGFILTVIDPSGSDAGYIVRINSDGQSMWQRSYGNSMLISVIQTSDQGFIAAGSSIVENGTRDSYIIKLDAGGLVQWQKTYGGSGDEISLCIRQTNDGRYIVGGISSSSDITGVDNHGGGDAYIIRLDANGEVIWQKMYGGSDEDSCSSISTTSDGGYIVAGTSNSIDIPGVNNHGLSDIYLLRLDPEGDVLWESMYGGSGDDNRNPFVGMHPTQDNGFIVTGQSSSTDIPGTVNHGGSDAYIIRANSDDEVIWQRMYGGSGNDSLSSIIQTDDGGFIAVGGSDSTNIDGTTNHGQSDAYVLKLDPSGNLQ
jgi:hypothetical protein